MTGPNRPGRWRIDMTEQEQLRQLKEEYENMIIPEAGRERLQAGIDRARMEKKRVEHARRRSAWTAVAAAAVVMIALPNTNIQIAHAMENIPLLGGFFRLVTVRQYNYSDENHDAEVELAQINYGEDAGEGASVGEVAATPKGTAAGSVTGGCGSKSVGRRCGSGQPGYGGYGRGTDPSVRGYLIRGRIPWSACVPGGRYGQ